MLSLILDFVTRHLPVVLVVALIAYALNNKYRAGITKYPGPSLAAWTDWWRCYDVSKGQHQETLIDLHRKHGDVVRLGPKCLSFANPDAIHDIYGLHKGYVKTEFYPVQQNISKGERLQSLFSTTDENFHAQLKRRVNSAFSMSTLLSYEPLVNETITAYLRRTEELFSKTGEAFDFPRWLQFFAFDVIGQLAFSKRLGFIDTNKDVGGITQSLADTFAYSAIVGQQPWLDRYFLRKNPIKLLLMKYGFMQSDNPIAKFATDRSNERKRELQQAKQDAYAADPEALEDEIKGVDFLTRCLVAQKAHPEFMTDRRVLSVATSLINAGSDTTAISLSSIMYYLLKTPRVYNKLMKELDECLESGTVNLTDDGIVTWTEAHNIPYLQAVIDESFRMFPAVGLNLERHVPAGGAIICGEHIPEGTIVGCNAWVLHRRPEIFGKDADEYRPERWLEADPEQLKKMHATMFQFGAGARTCIGRHISLLEIYKLVPSFLLRFRMESAMEDGEWRPLNVWFVRQLGFNVRVHDRVGASSDEKL